MILRDLIDDVLRTLWSHKLRTFLTMFGIAWGIVSIVLMVAAGEGLRKGQEEQGGRGRGGWCIGKTPMWRQCNRKLPIASMPFLNWSNRRFEPTATTTTRHLP